MILSIILGMLPEILFFTLYIITTKDLKNRRILLFILISIVYISCISIIQYVSTYYISFLFLYYIVVKIIYRKKTDIIDVFVTSIACIYLGAMSCLCFIFVKDDFSNYYILLIINRMLLFLPFIFWKKFNFLYINYRKLWNREEKTKKPIKSITLRNISLVGINIFIFVCNIVCIYIMKIVR